MEYDDDTEDLIPPEVDPENYIFALYITEQLRQIFLLALLTGNFLSISIGVIFLCLAWFTRSTVEHQLHFLHEYYQPNAVPVMVGLSGLIMLGASVLGVKAAIDGRMLQDEEADLKNLSKIFFAYAVAAAAACGAVFMTALTCFIEIAVLSSALGDALLEGMEKYMTDADVKPEIDMMQMDYKCCGSKNYRDWFNISWQDAKYLETQDGFIQSSLKKGKYFGKDVPFSCCRWDVMRPCVDTRIEDSSYNSKYTYPEDLTLYKKGCKEAISHYLGHTVFTSVGLFLLLCSILWLCLAVMGRYMNTSVAYLSVGDDPIGWLVPYQKSALRPSGTSEDTEESYEDEV